MHMIWAHSVFPRLAPEGGCGRAVQALNGWQECHLAEVSQIVSPTKNNLRAAILSREMRKVGTRRVEAFC
jgi:hypothetical protein